MSPSMTHLGQVAFLFAVSALSVFVPAGRSQVGAFTAIAG